MSNLTNTIEAIVFASGEPVPVKFLVEKLGVTIKEANSAIGELKEKYGEDCGINLLTFNGKIQFASNPKYKEKISEVLIPIKEKEFTKTILECAAIIAYKQPITKPELEEIRQVSCDYAIHTLLELGMIVPCGRKDALGRPILYATTDEFLKRFRLNSIDQLPDYDDLMEQISKNKLLQTEEDANYLYKKDEYVEEDENADKEVSAQPETPKRRVTEDGLELPDFIGDGDDIIRID